jgi:hypothetical protein
MTCQLFSSIAASLQGIQWLPDSSEVTYQKSGKIYRYSVEKKTESLLLDPETLVFKDEKVLPSSFLGCYSLVDQHVELLHH